MRTVFYTGYGRDGDLVSGETKVKNTARLHDLVESFFKAGARKMTFADDDGKTVATIHGEAGRRVFRVYAWRAWGKEKSDERGE